MRKIRYFLRLRTVENMIGLQQLLLKEFQITNFLMKKNVKIKNAQDLHPKKHISIMDLLKVKVLDKERFNGD